MSGDEPSADDDTNPVLQALQRATPAPIRRSYAVKFGLVLLLMAVSIGVIGVAATQAVTDQTEQNAMAEYESVAGQEASIINQWLERNTLSVEMTADKSAWAQPEEELSGSLRSEARKMAGDTEVMHILDDRHGLQVTASHSETGSVRIDEDGYEWFDDALSDVRELSSGDVHVTDTYESGGSRYVGFITPTPPVDDRYLFIEVSVFDIQDALEGSERAERGFTQVVNEDSTLVMIDEHGEDGKLLEEYASSESALEPLHRANELRDDSLNNSGVIAEMPADPDVITEEYTVGYAPVDDTNWAVLTHGPRSSVFGFVETLSTWGIIITLFSVVLIGVTGTVLGYSTSTSIDRLTRKTEEMREGNLDVRFHTTRIDNIGRLYDGFADMRDTLKQQIREAESARKEAEVARAEAEEMAAYLQETAEEYSDVMQQVSAGDLTMRMEVDGEEASMDHIAEEFNAMVEELEKTTGQLKSYVDEVEEAGAEVEQSSDTVRDASEQVADSIQTISDDAYDQKDRLQGISETMDEVVETLEQYTDEHEDIDIESPLERIEAVSTTLNEVADLSEETMGEAEHVAGAAEEQAAELNEVSGRANDLQRYAQPLRDILERFETEAEHEFVFSVGPTGSAADEADEETS